MKKPTYQEFVLEMRRIELLEGTKMKQNEGMPVPDPLTDEELMEMWECQQTEPATNVFYGGEIKSLT